MNDKIQNAILNYVNFLNATFDIFQKLDTIIENSSYLIDLQNDFLQTNWEILVESIICESGKEFLEIYGEGADCYGDSSRVCFPDKKPTHRIILKPKHSEYVLDRLTGENINMQEFLFNSFVSNSDNNSNQKPPFNAVLIEHKTKDRYAVVDIDDVIFEKIKIGL